MAIFHLNVTCHSRTAGHSAVGGAAYRAGEKLIDDRTGLVHDYSRKQGVEASFIVLPEGIAPMSRQQLWDAVEAAEKRKNSTVAREIEISLPHELNSDERQKLALGFTDWLVKKYGFAADMSLHNPTKKNDEKNFHAHIYTSTRVLTETGFSEKIRVLDAAKTGSLEINEWREEWANRVNAALKKNEIESRIDHRSHAARDLVDLPTRHEGNGPQAARIKAQNDEVKELNGINAELAALLRERAQLTAQNTIRDASRQAQADAKKTMEGPTLAQLDAQRLDACNAAQEAAKAITKAKADRERASPQKFVLEARAALPEAMKNLDAAKTVFEALEAKGTPWYMPWRRTALERAQDAYSTAKTTAQELGREARAPVLEEVEKARREAEKRLDKAQAESERIEHQMMATDVPRPAPNAIMTKAAKRP